MWQYQQTEYKSLCIDMANMEHEMYDHISINWSNKNSNNRFKEKFGSHSRKTFNIFIMKPTILGI